MNHMDNLELYRTHLIWALPVWTAVTWLLLLVIAWCIVGLKKKMDCLIDQFDCHDGKQDAYFGLPKLEGEAVAMRDMEVRRIRDETAHPTNDEDWIKNRISDHDIDIDTESDHDSCKDQSALP